MDLPADDLAGHCLDWLAERDETELPVVLFSGGDSADACGHVLACNPRIIVTAEAGRLQVSDHDGGLIEHAPLAEVLDVLRRHTGSEGRWIGYFGYDLAWVFEYGLPRYLPPSSTLPDLWLAWYDDPRTIDIAPVGSGGGRAPEDHSGDAGALVMKDPAFHREEYEAAVDRIREHCLRGDLFQADLSRRIELEVEGTAMELFGRLMHKSPAPFMAYLGLGGGRAVVSSSPEEFLRVRGSAVRTRPIKGTRPRGRDPAKDAALCDELLASEKDLAELTMIVDLMRNDLGRVARPGSVEVGDFPSLMTLPYVHHLYATIEAELNEGYDVWDLLAASFPPGSISGAPKPKAIEILELVERSRRGVYTGAIGWIGADGDAHLNVAIRTAEWDNGRLRFGVGGGITALSDASLEFEETLDKARGLAAALGVSRR